jgi:DNA-binding PadR family transcriptional regulator
MNDNVENLILDLLEWAGSKERTYQETMDAWRTSCPRLPVWEDANDRGLLEVGSANGRSVVRLTTAGRAVLREKRPHCCEPRQRQDEEESRATSRTRN